MKCEQSQRLIHLYRPGERSPSESRDLAEHLVECLDCRALQEEVQLFQSMVEGIPDPLVNLSFPELFTEQILNHCVHREEHPILESVFLWLQKRSVQLTFACLVLLLVGSFIGENLYTSRKILALEIRMQEQGLKSSRGNPSFQDLKVVQQSLSDLVDHPVSESKRRMILNPFHAQGMRKLISYYKDLTPFRKKLFCELIFQESR
jgi:hypothetical protein